MRRATTLQPCCETCQLIWGDDLPSDCETVYLWVGLEPVRWNSNSAWNHTGTWTHSFKLELFTWWLDLLRLRFWAVAPRVVFKRRLGCGFGLLSGGLRSTPQSSAGGGREAGVSHQFAHSFYRYPNLYWAPALGQGLFRPLGLQRLRMFCSECCALENVSNTSFYKWENEARPKAHRGSVACPGHVSSRQGPSRKMGMTLGHWSHKGPSLNM